MSETRSTLGPYTLFEGERTQRLTSDTLALAEFLPKPGGDASLIELGTGSGAMLLWLAWKTTVKRLIGCELQEVSFERAEKNVRHNGLSGRIVLIKSDWRALGKLYPEGAFDVVVCNPPYIKAGSGRVSPFKERAAARAETAGTLRELVEISAYLAGPSGRVCYVYPEKRLADMLGALEENGLRQVRLEYVHADRSGEPRRFLIEAARGDFSG